jgi:hypothetical protein
MTCFTIIFVLPTIILILTNVKFCKINKSFIILYVCFITMIFTTIWYLIQGIILIEIALYGDTSGFDSTLTLYLIFTSVLKLGFGISANIILYKN